jgi:hypothetical protein
MYVERDHLKCDFKIELIQLAVFNKDRHMAKSITLKTPYLLLVQAKYLSVPL